jgi:hypothetical protein
MAWPTIDDFRSFLGLEATDDFDPTAVQAAYDYAQGFAVTRCGIDETLGPPDGITGEVARGGFLALGADQYETRNRPGATQTTSATPRRRQAIADLRGGSVTVG